MAHLSLSWDAYKSNICNGLSALQQNGEFVDMTLAADGHYVKVHQLVMSLASPYIKDIITSTQCQHPVIFLNKISYTTLCAILEYVYTGEVLIAKENLNQIMEAAKELHIRGLENVKTIGVSTAGPYSHSAQALLASQNVGQPLDKSLGVAAAGPYSHTAEALVASRNIAKQLDVSFEYKEVYPKKLIRTKSKEGQKEIKVQNATDDDITLEEEFMDDTANDTYETMENTQEIASLSASEMTKGVDPHCQVQYTLSNQGSLQMILNRYIYNLRYTSRRDCSQRQWRCIDLRDHKCQAAVITKGEAIVTRIAAHNHPFHDHKILKKVRNKAVFGAIREAEAISESKKQKRESRVSAAVLSDGNE